MKNQRNKFPLEPKVNWYRLPEEVDEISKTVATIGTRQGPPGIQGVPGLQGTQGVPGLQGTVGPAGLNWQGTWVSGTSYVADDAVGYGGASWFCILATSGTIDPDVDTTHWALLASQGAPGIQGIQGVTGLQGNTGAMPWNLPATVYNNGTSYGIGDAVTFQGGYYYRSGNPSNPGYPPTPGSINASWTPVADKGDAGVAPIKTNGLVYGPATTGNVYTTLPYDFNQIAEGIGNKFKLPATTSSDIGKEVVVYNMGNNCVIYTNDIGSGIQTSVSGFTNQKNVVYNDFVKFTCTGVNIWQMSFLSAVYPTLNGKNLVAYTGAIYTYTINATTSALSLATLNSTYPNASTILEYKVYCPNISGGGLVYIKTNVATWVSSSITSIV